ncbi:MAG TPA: zinc ribbon domain-containing protein [Pyrinomonadaceae bacterium]|jgi:TRAP-type uncharacterized transport system fused permease subunit
MYCPHCGAQNAGETKFCRSCGEDLRLVAQAVTKSLPLVIAHRVDEAIDRGRGGWRTYQLFRKEHRAAFSQTLMGLAALFVIVWMLMLGHGSVSFASGFLLVMVLAIIITSVHALLTRKRTAPSNQEGSELPSTLNTRELLTAQEIPAASVTESTTRRLKTEANRSTREDTLN